MLQLKFRYDREIDNSERFVLFFEILLSTNENSWHAKNNGTTSVISEGVLKSQGVDLVLTPPNCRVDSDHLVQELSPFLREPAAGQVQLCEGFVSTQSIAENLQVQSAV